MQLLDTLLRQVAQRCQPSEADFAIRQRAVQAIERVLGNGGIRGISQHNGPAVQPYGSFISGFYGPGSDLDLAINGYVDSRTLSRRTLDVLFQGAPIEDWVPLHKLDKHAKAAQLRTVADLLLQRGVAKDMQRILHARVPLLKFVERSTGVECDLCMGNDGASFKAAFVKQLADFDPRFGQLFRMVKLWAKAHGLNDSSNGTFNSWCLTLMVIFHLQTVTPAVLPPLFYFFQDQQPHYTAQRLLQGDLGDLTAVFRSLEVCRARHGQIQDHFRRSHAAAGAPVLTALELFQGFLTAMAGHLQAVTTAGVPSTRRMSVWLGNWVERAPFKSQYVMLVEDPFDCTDNPGRTLGIWDKIVATVHYTQSVFAESARVLASVRSPPACPAAVAWLFGPDLLLVINRPAAEAPELRDDLRQLFDSACLSQVQRALRAQQQRIDVFRELLQYLSCPHTPVLCYDDFRVMAAQAKASNVAAARARRRQQHQAGSDAQHDDGQQGRLTAAAASMEDMETDLLDGAEGEAEAPGPAAVAGMAAAALVVGETSAEVAEAQRLAKEAQRKKKAKKRLAKQQQDISQQQPLQAQQQPHTLQQHEQPHTQQQQPLLLAHQQSQDGTLAAPKPPKREKHRVKAASSANPPPGMGYGSSPPPGMGFASTADRSDDAALTGHGGSSSSFGASATGGALSVQPGMVALQLGGHDAAQRADADAPVAAAVKVKKPKKSRKLSEADRQRQGSTTSDGGPSHELSQAPLHPPPHHEASAGPEFHPLYHQPPPPPLPRQQQQHRPHPLPLPPPPTRRQGQQAISEVQRSGSHASTSGRGGSGRHTHGFANGSDGDACTAVDGAHIAAGYTNGSHTGGTDVQFGVRPSKSERSARRAAAAAAAVENGGDAHTTQHGGGDAGGASSVWPGQAHGSVSDGHPGGAVGGSSGRRGHKMQPGSWRKERRAAQQQQQD